MCFFFCFWVGTLLSFVAIVLWSKSTSTLVVDFDRRSLGGSDNIDLERTFLKLARVQLGTDLGKRKFGESIVVGK